MMVVGFFEDCFTTATEKLFRPVCLCFFKSLAWVKKLRRPAFEFRHVAASVDARGHVAARCFEFPLYLPCFRPWRRHFPFRPDGGRNRIFQWLLVRPWRYADPSHNSHRETKRTPRTKPALPVGFLMRTRLPQRLARYKMMPKLADEFPGCVKGD